MLGLVNEIQLAARYGQRARWMHPRDLSVEYRSELGTWSDTLDTVGIFVLDDEHSPYLDTYRELISKAGIPMTLLRSTQTEYATLTTYLSHGFNGYLDIHSLTMTTIRAVIVSMELIRPQIESEPITDISPGAHNLTKSEIPILMHVGRGLSNRGIAKEICIAEDTVKTHLKNTYEKLGANDRSHAIAEAMRRGIISRDTVLDSFQ